MEVTLARSRSPPRERPAPVPIPIVGQVFHNSLFDGTGVPALALCRALQQLWQEGICINYVGGHHYEIDTDAARMRQAIVTADFPLKSIHRGDISNFVADAKRFRITPMGTVINTIGSPCTVISIGIFSNSSRNAQELVGPHAKPSNLIWPAHEGLHHLQLPPKHRRKIVVMMEMVPPAMQAWQQELEQHFGPVHRVDTTTHGGADRNRDKYTSPYLVQTPDAHIQSANYINPHFLPDGCVWPASPQAMNMVQPPTIRSIYPKLIISAMNPGSSESDIRTIAKFKIRTPSGMIRFAGPPHLAHWLGWPTKYIKQMLQIFPCPSGILIDDISGLPGNDTPVDRCHPCGQVRLCVTCCIAADLLGRSWHVETATDVLRQLLRTHFTDKEAVYHPFHLQQPHRCEHPCPLATTLGTARKSRSQAQDTLIIV